LKNLSQTECQGEQKSGLSLNGLLRFEKINNY